MLGSKDCFRMFRGARLAEADAGPSCFERAPELRTSFSGALELDFDYIRHTLGSSNDI